jgi:hypothetical protein
MMHELLLMPNRVLSSILSSLGPLFLLLAHVQIAPLQALFKADESKLATQLFQILADEAITPAIKSPTLPCQQFIADL